MWTTDLDAWRSLPKVCASQASRSVVAIQVQNRSSAAEARMPSTCSAPSGSRTTIRPSSLCARFSNMPIGMMLAYVRRKPMEKAELLLSAARYLNETLEPERVYARFHELLEDAVPH